MDNKEYLKEWRKKNPNYDREYYIKNKKRRLENQKIIYQLNKNKLNSKRMTKYIKNHDLEKERMRITGRLNREKRNKYEKEHPVNKLKYKSRYLSRYKIPLKSSCDICNEKDNLQRHHWNYNNPLSINTLCRTCHNIQHVKHFERSIYAN